MGTFAEPTAFSFHPAELITTGEGGMIVTDDSDTALRMRAFRNHGISTEARARPAGGLKVRDSGPRIQLPPDRLPARPRDEPDREASGLARRRQALAAKYDRALGDLDGITPIAVREEVEHAYHLYVRPPRVASMEQRDTVFRAMRARGLGLNVHYIPVHPYPYPYYRKHFGTRPGQFHIAEEAYNEILTLPSPHKCQRRMWMRWRHPSGRR